LNPATSQNSRGVIVSWEAMPPAGRRLLLPKEVRVGCPRSRGCARAEAPRGARLQLVNPAMDEADNLVVVADEQVRIVQVAQDKRVGQTTALLLVQFEHELLDRRAIARDQHARGGLRHCAQRRTRRCERE
jgi:hypothetical protein